MSKKKNNNFTIAVVAIAAVMLILGLMMAFSPDNNMTGAVIYDPACGTIVTDDVILTGDIGPCPGNGLVVGADEITIDCQGHKITGTNTFPQRGIVLVGRQGVTIKNCDIGYFAWSGIYLEASSNNNIINNKIHDQKLATGIDMYLCDYNNIESNELYQNAYSISLGFCYNNNIIYNFLHDAPEDDHDDRAILLFYSSNNKIMYNTIDYDFPITNNIALLIWFDSDNNVINYNNFNYYPGKYVQVDNWQNTNNDFTNNWWGIAPPDCTKFAGFDPITCYPGPGDDLYPWLTEPWTPEPPCESTTGNYCVDGACCSMDNCYEDEFMLYNHGMYISCVADATKTCGLEGKARGETVNAAAKSNVNKPGYCENSW